MAFRPDYIARDGLTLGAEWGQVYTLDAIHTFAARAITGSAEVRFSERLRGDGYDWREAFPLTAGSGWVNVTDGDLAAFSHLQFRLAAGVAAGTLDFRAFCRG